MTNILGRSLLFFFFGGGGGGGGTEDFRFDSKILTWFPPRHCSFLMIPSSPLIGSLFSTDLPKEIPLASQIINETTGPLVQLRFARKKGNYISQKIKKCFSKLNLF